MSLVTFARTILPLWLRVVSNSEDYCNAAQDSQQRVNFKPLRGKLKGQIPDEAQPEGELTRMICVRNEQNRFDVVGQ